MGLGTRSIIKRDKIMEEKELKKETAKKFTK